MARGKSANVGELVHLSNAATVISIPHPSTQVGGSARFMAVLHVTRFLANVEEKKNQRRKKENHKVTFD
jgi:hypothetical protein